jgi:Outer membrane protein beta-barrel domain
VAKTILLGLIIVASASIAVAQDDYRKWEIFGGYSRNNVDSGISDNDPELGFIDVREGFNGFNASVTGNLTRYFGLKFDVSGHYKNQTIPFTTIGRVDVNSSLYNFLGGVQIKDNSKESTFKPFAHALVGAAHGRNRVNFTNDFCIAIAPVPCPADLTDSETGLAGAFGGGLDIRVSNRIDIRAIQIDYNPTRLGDSTQHNIRWGVGIVIH